MSILSTWYLESSTLFVLLDCNAAPKMSKIPLSSVWSEYKEKRRGRVVMGFSAKWSILVSFFLCLHFAFPSLHCHFFNLLFFFLKILQVWQTHLKATVETKPNKGMLFLNLVIRASRMKEWAQKKVRSDQDLVIR